MAKKPELSWEQYVTAANAREEEKNGRPVSGVAPQVSSADSFIRYLGLTPKSGDLHLYAAANGFIGAIACHRLGIMSDENLEDAKVRLTAEAMKSAARSKKALTDADILGIQGRLRGFEIMATQHIDTRLIGMGATLPDEIKLIEHRPQGRPSR